MMEKEQDGNSVASPRAIAELFGVARTSETARGHARKAVGGSFFAVHGGEGKSVRIPLFAYLAVGGWDGKGNSTFSTDCALGTDGAESVVMVQLKRGFGGDQPSRVVRTMAWMSEIPEELRPEALQFDLTEIPPKAVEWILARMDRDAPLMSI